MACNIDGDSMFPDWLLPRDLTEFMLVLVMALIADYIYPYHSGLMLKVHPVHTSYVTALALYRRLPRSKASGFLIWASITALHVGIYGSLLYVLSNFRILWILASAYILKVSTSLRLLAIHVLNVREGLKVKDLEYARKYVSGIVRRDVSGLGEGHIASAAIESLFESLVDGFASPMLYYVFLGPIGALFQRIVNTLDSALGYRSEEFLQVGWLPAKADTLINYIPARLTSLLIIASCPLVGSSLVASLKTYIRDRALTLSLNSGNVMASASGCLRIRLEKIGEYCIGREFRLPNHDDIGNAIKLWICTIALYQSLMICIYIAYYVGIINFISFTGLDLH